VVTVRSFASSETRSVTTEAGGHFEIDGLTVGPYTVTAEASGYEPASSNALIDRDSVEVTLYLKSVNGSTSKGRTQATVTVHQLRIPSKAQDFYEKGLRLIEKDPAASVSYFTKAIGKYSNYYEAYYEMGQAQVRLNQTNEATKSFRTAIDLSGGTFAAAELAYGMILCQQGKTREGEQVARHGLEQDSNMSYAYYLVLAVVQLHLNRPEEAEKNAVEVLLRNPRIPDAYLVLADSHGARENYAAEVKDLEAFLRLVPEGPRSNVVRDLRNAAQRLASESAAASQQAKQIAQRPVLNTEAAKPRN
jgi:tetratricopeptide (TPR) repeat protein